ncbi:MAG: GNAT family N-acetyltransferase [Planctomycetaceae bacterium]
MGKQEAQMLWLADGTCCIVVPDELLRLRTDDVQQGIAIRSVLEDCCRQCDSRSPKYSYALLPEPGAARVAQVFGDCGFRQIDRIFEYRCDDFGISGLPSQDSTADVVSLSPDAAWPDSFSGLLDECLKSSQDLSQLPIPTAGELRALWTSLAHVCCFVANVEGFPAGICVVSGRRSDRRTIEYIAVRPRFRRQRIAARLLEGALHDDRSPICDRTIRAFVAETNPVSRQFF